MFLKSLDINGFKSFPDRTHIDFTDGITSLLGPNGCGKSNIVDSIKWVLGEQSTKTLRASSMQDVIFNGTDTRKPLQMAEVTLTIDNESHHLQTDVPEIVIRRRVYRTGESEYYLNGQRCLLKNIKELFLDTGVGKTAYSILEQGKIDQILSNKPEDRRYIFEEAAGISRYKQKCHEAQNRIERANENIEKLMITFNETKRTYDRTKNQALKAIEWEELSNKAFELDIDLRLSRLKMFQDLKAHRIKLRDEAEKRRDELKLKLEAYNDDISTSSGEVNEYRENVRKLEIAITHHEASIEGINSTISALEDNYRSYIETLNSGQAKCASIESEINRYKNDRMVAEEQLGNYQDNLEEKESQLRYTENLLLSTRDEISRLEKEIDDAELRNANLDDELSMLSEELKSVIESLIAEVDEKTGSEYSSERREGAENSFHEAMESIRKSIENRLAFISSLPDGVAYSKEIAIKDFSSLYKDIDEIILIFNDYKDSIPPVIDTLLSPEGLMTKKRNVEKREREARSEIERNRAFISESKTKLGTLNLDIHSIQTNIASIKEHLGSLRIYVDSQKDKIKTLDKTIMQREFELEDEISKTEIARTRVSEIAEKIHQKDSEKENLSNEIARLRGEKKQIDQLLSDRFNFLNSKITEKDNAFRAMNEAGREYDAQTMYLEQTDNAIRDVFTSFFDQYARNLAEFEERMRDNLPSEQELRTELESVNKEIQSLGAINHAAKSDFDKAEDDYKFISKQLLDLENAKADMQSVLDEIQGKSVELFLKSYNEISDNFQAMFRRLFGGGRAELRLVDPENVLTSGIDILAQPPGKSMATLSLLSGGERSMTAVALLFATYQVKPSPFCILDEIDAALDDRNIGFFLDVLQEFAKDSQFIIITHNKHTVTGGNSMLGVSQMEAGVSTAVAYRIGRVKGQPVIMNEDDEEIEFDSEGNRR